MAGKCECAKCVWQQNEVVLRERRRVWHVLLSGFLVYVLEADFKASICSVAFSRLQ